MLAAVAVLTGAVLAPRVFGALNIFDEGFIASGAAAILRGALPVRDFFVIYGPGQYYLTALVFALFGDTLAASRCAHLAVLTLLGLAVTVLSSRLTGERYRAPAATVAVFLMASTLFTPNSGYAAVLGTLLLLAACWPMAAWATQPHRRQIAIASCLIGLAGLVRWDFGVFGAVALLVTLGVALGADRHRRPNWTTTVLATLAPAALVAAAGFLPFVLVGEPARWFAEVPRFHLMAFKVWRNLDFVHPSLSGLVHAWRTADAPGFTRNLCALQMAALPLLVAPAAALVATVRLHRGRSLHPGTDTVALMLSLLSLCLYNQMRVRPGFPQGYPTFVAALPLVSYLLQAVLRRRGRPALHRGVVAALVLQTASFAYLWQHEVRNMVSSTAVSTALPRAGSVRLGSGERTQQGWADYIALVQHLQRHTQPGEPIFSGVQDTSRLFVNDALLYFLADRPAATRFIEMEPGITNTAPAQQQLVTDLQDHDVKTVVLLDQLSTEPNATARSNGVHVLDGFIQQHYGVSARFGRYTVMARRAP